MSHEYGVSFNCLYKNELGLTEGEVGGGGEGPSTLDYVGNDLDKIEAYLIEDATDQRDRNRSPYVDYSNYVPTPFVAVRDHELVGKGVDIGGEIVSVIVDDCNDSLEDAYVLCVIFDYSGTNGPTEIE